MKRNIQIIAKSFFLIKNTIIRRYHESLFQISISKKSCEKKEKKFKHLLIELVLSLFNHKPAGNCLNSTFKSHIRLIVFQNFGFDNLMTLSQKKRINGSK